MSTTFRPNCRVTVLDTADSGTVDDNGDPVEDDVVKAEGLPAFWGQHDERSWDPVTQRTTIIRGYLVRLRPGTEVAEGQRLRNERTGAIGYVRLLERETTLGRAGDVLVRLISTQK